MKKFLKIVGIAAAVAVLAVLVLGAVAFAQGPPGGPWFGPFGGRLGHFPFFGNDQAEAYREQTQEALANALGLSVEELDAARDEGKSLLEIAEAQGVDMADVQAAVKAASEQLIDQAVADGLLTQEQADNIRQHGQDRADRDPLGMLGMRGGFPGRPGGRGFFPFAGADQVEAFREQMQEAMANALGLSVEELDAARQEAVKAASEQLLDQAVADGLLTQEQADSMRQHWQDMADYGPLGMLGMRSGFPGWPGGRGFFPFADPDQAEAYREQTQEALANALGLSVEELDAARDGGKSLLEIAEAQGVDMADVEEAMRAASEQLIDQAVADGLLTQEQADTIRQRTDEVPGPGGMRRGDGFHRMPGWRGRKAN